MKSPIRKSFVALALLTLLVPIASARAQETIVTYQGRVMDNGTNFTGSGQFKFALVAGTSPSYTTEWSNDGTSSGGSQPTKAVTMPVAGGLFTVNLGDTTVSNMTALPVSVFNQSGLQLAIWFSDGANGFAELTPLQILNAAPYAVAASNLVGTLSASQISGTIASGSLPANPVFSGEITAGSFVGNGSGLTNVPLAALGSGGTLNLATNGLLFTPYGTATVGNEPVQIVPAVNLNGTGRTDLVVPNQFGGTVSVLTNNGTGGFALSTTLNTSSAACVAVADFNNDGRPDIAVVAEFANSVIIYTNMGGGQFYSNQTVTVGSYPAWIAAVTNLSGAGKTGLIVSSPNDGKVMVLTNNGAGIMASNATLTAGPQVTGLAVADFNNDGKPDFAATINGGATLIVFTNTGFGGFTSNATLTVGQSPSLIVAADINGDGAPDLICANRNDNSLSVLTNFHGVFTLASTITGAGTVGLAVGDFNSDGQPDLVCSAEANTLQIALNLGHGTFSLPTAFECASPGVGLGPLAVMDLNGDGVADIIAGDYSGTYVLELLNQSGLEAAGFSVGAGGFRLTPGWTGVPDVVGGSSGNVVDAMVAGSVIGGGGSVSNINHVAADESSILGGEGNSIQSNANHSVVAGGYFNTNAGEYAFLGAGNGNVISSAGSWGFLGGGSFNGVTATSGVIVGGGNNEVSAGYAAIVGGYNNIAGGYGAFIGGGGTANAFTYGPNYANGGAAVVAGGLGNQANGSYATVPGGAYNFATGNYSLAAGQQAQALHAGAFVWADSQSSIFASTTSNQFLIRAQNGVGINTNDPSAALSVNGAVMATSFAGDGSGLTNLSLNNANDSAVASGPNNTVTGSSDSVIAGGTNNILTNVSASAIVGGQGNVNNGNQSTIGGGGGNIIDVGAYYAFIGSGGGNIIQTNAYDSFMGSGYHNLIAPGAIVGVISGGQNNTISNNAQFAVLTGGLGNTNTGSYSVIPGGAYNVAAAYSYAAGSNAVAANASSFVWSDGSAPTRSVTNNSVTLRATNGYRFFTGTNGSILFTNYGGSGASESVSWTPGTGSWSFTSDRNAKDQFTKVDPRAVLDKVAQLPISEWSYKGHDQRHIGAMAQDFHALFPLNDNDKALNDADLHGVELAAIKGLNQKLESEAQAKEARINELEKRLEALQQTVQLLAAKPSAADK